VGQDRGGVVAPLRSRKPLAYALRLRNSLALTGEGSGDVTLIVGLANKDLGFLVGETLLTPLLEIKGNPTGPVNGEFHGLKIQILNGETAIAFATSNAAEVALRVIASVAGAIANDPQTDVFEKTKEEYLASVGTAAEKPDCEFLVLRLEKEKNRLAHISPSEIRFVERAYIGDRDQWAVFNKLRVPYEPPKVAHVQQPDGSFKVVPVSDTEGDKEFMEVCIALESLVQQRKRNGVGAIAGNVIRVRDAAISGKLEYLQTHMAGVSAEEGHMGFSLLASNTGRRGVGIYYIAGKMGFLMIVGDTETCRKVSAETMDAFKRAAQENWGLTLS